MTTPATPARRGVLVVGSVTADLTTFSDRLPVPGETIIGREFTLVLGGKGANQAVAAGLAVVVHGAADPMMGAPEQERMAQALGVAVVSVPDRGHLLPLEAPRECAAALSDLWDRARAGS